MKFRRFKPTNWSIDNKTSIYFISILITLFGLIIYNSLPKENFPEVDIPTVFVATAYPGTSPADIENLVTRPLEKQLKSIEGVKKITSNSVQGFSSIVIEFNTGIDITDAKQKVRDAVDKAQSDLPSDLPKQPMVKQVDISEMPIMLINMSGDFSLKQLKKYADDLKDKIEELKGINRVDEVGALEREIQVDVNMYKMQAAMITPTDIERAIQSENLTISGGSIRMGMKQRSIRIKGQFDKVSEIGNIIIRGMTGSTVKLKDIAKIEDTHKDRESFATVNGKNSITLNVIKRSGANLLDAANQTKKVVAEMKKNNFPASLNVGINADQSLKTKTTLKDLINSIVIGFILVAIILMFFMGPTNAIFVGLSVPLSIFLSFLFLPEIGFSLNMMVLFSFLFALGIIVDDAIVVIENSHRIFNEQKGKLSVMKAAKIAAGEIFVPVLSGTLTTIAPFLPLAFWPGIVGSFMFYLPITIMIALLSSLVVAFIINPVFAVSFMKLNEDEYNISAPKKVRLKKLRKPTYLFLGFAVICYLLGFIGIANFAIFILFLLYLNEFVLKKAIKHFDTVLLPKFINGYKKLLAFSLKKWNPVKLLVGMVVLIFVTGFLMAIIKPAVVFFPKSEPDFIYAYVQMPIGTDIHVTDSVTNVVAKRVNKVIHMPNPIVQSVITNVGIGAGDPNDFTQAMNSSPNKGKVTVSFVNYEDRKGQSTAAYLAKIRDAVKGIPGAVISVDQNQNGPPVGKPINIEVSGDNYPQLIKTSNELKNYLDSIAVPGVEELKSDLQNNKPEIIIDIDRNRARRLNISTAQIATAVRTAVFGKKASKYRDNKDEYDIVVRYQKNTRDNINALINLPITYRDMNLGGRIRQVPLSSVANIKYSSTYGGIKRINGKRVITLSSNVLNGFTANEVVADIQNHIKSGFSAPKGVTIKMTGQQEDQKESSNFLIMAFAASIGLIFLILVTQFNSISKPLIILSEIIFSVVGVLLGFTLCGMQISIVMTGFGIVGLAGIVVKNGILLLEFMDVQIQNGMPIKEAIIKAGSLRIKPVLLTAIATNLGLLAMAVGFNINFISLFTHLSPQIFFGGENAAFFGPLCWAIIFGLTFATFLTLILAPVMYYLVYRLKVKWHVKPFHTTEEVTDADFKLVMEHEHEE